jgi:hypothetical protein
VNGHASCQPGFGLGHERGHQALAAFLDGLPWHSFARFELVERGLVPDADGRRKEDRGVLLHPAVQHDLFRAVTLVEARHAIGPGDLA